MSAHLVEVARWLANDAPPMEPGEMQFRAVAANGIDPCSGCVFKGQKSKVCMAAGTAAHLARLPDCEDRDTATGKTFIYVLTKADRSQLRIVTEESA